MIFQDAVPHLKSFLKPVALGRRAQALVIRCMLAFLMHLGKMSASQAAGSGRPGERRLHGAGGPGLHRAHTVLCGLSTRSGLRLAGGWGAATILPLRLTKT